MKWWFASKSKFKDLPSFIRRMPFPSGGDKGGVIVILFQDLFLTD
jgi:hypothetical protein